MASSLDTSGSIGNRKQTRTYLQNSDDTIKLIENGTEAGEVVNTPAPIKPTATPVSPVPMTLVPIVAIVCGIFLVAALIAIIIFRKHICHALNQPFQNQSKLAKAKKSNQSQAPDDAMVMQQWNGPLAYNNRYTPWTTGMHDQVQTQISNSSFSHYPKVQQQFDHWEFPRHRLKVFNILGEGAFGQVWRCEGTDIDGVDGISTVAVKTLKEGASETEKTDLLAELQVMKSLEPHVNVVRLLGCCTEKDPVFVVIEYVSLGKLQTFLRNSRVEKWVL